MIGTFLVSLHEDCISIFAFTAIYIFMTIRYTYSAFVLSVMALLASACDKTCQGGLDSNVVDMTYRFEIVNQSGIDLSLSFESPAMPPEQIDFKTDGSRFEIAIAADETLLWVETLNIMMPEGTAVNGFMWSWVRDLRIDYSDGVCVDGQSLPEDRRPTEMRAYAIVGTSRPESGTGSIDGTARYVFTASDYRYAAERARRASR